MTNILLVFSKNASKDYRLSDKEAFNGFVTYFLFIVFCIFLLKKISNKLDK